MKINREFHFKLPSPALRLNLGRKNITKIVLKVILESLLEFSIVEKEHIAYLWARRTEFSIDDRKYEKIFKNLNIYLTTSHPKCVKN